MRICLVFQMKVSSKFDFINHSGQDGSPLIDVKCKNNLLEVRIFMSKISHFFIFREFKDFHSSFTKFFVVYLS